MAAGALAWAQGARTILLRQATEKLGHLGKAAGRGPWRRREQVEAGPGKDLTVERTTRALEALAVASAAAAADGSGGAVADDIRELIAFERNAVEERRRAYEESMHRLAEELMRQQVGRVQLEELERLSNALEAALERVAELELESAPRRRAIGSTSKSQSCTIC
jgi:hypothetical protein